MPVYVNFFYIPAKKELLPENETILKLVDHLVDSGLVNYQAEEGAQGRTRKQGLFTRLKVMVLGEMQKKEEGPKVIPPTPGLLLSPQAEELVDLNSREDLVEHLPGDGDYVRIQLPYLTKSFVQDRLEGKAFFERGFTITRSPVPLPLLDAYENLQAGCRACKHVFDPRDHLESPVRVKCPGCQEVFDLADLKATPPIPFHTFLVGLEQSKIVDTQEDDPAHNGLNLTDLAKTFEEVLGGKFQYRVVYT